MEVEEEVGQNQVGREGEEEVVGGQNQVGQEGEGVAAADHLQGAEVVEGVVAVPQWCLVKGEEEEVVVLRGLVGEGEEVAGAGVGVLQVFDSDPWSQG